MTENPDAAEQAADTADADVDASTPTDFAAVLMQNDKGRAHAEASRALDEVVQAALATGKKGGSVTVQVKAEPLESGAVRLVTLVKSNPVKDPAGSIWFADGAGQLSRDNAGLFYGTK